MGGHNIESYAAAGGWPAVRTRNLRADTHVCWRPYTRGYRTKKSKCIYSSKTILTHRHVYPNILKGHFTQLIQTPKILNLFF